MTDEVMIGEVVNLGKTGAVISECEWDKLTIYYPVCTVLSFLTTHKIYHSRTPRASQCFQA